MREVIPVSAKKDSQMGDDYSSDSLSEKSGIDGLKMLEVLNFDDILTEIGFGRHQITLFILMGCIGVAEAAEAQVLSILQPILKTEWQLETYEENAMISLVFVGYLIGSFCSGKVSDQYGRSRPLKYGSIGLFICAIGSALAPEFITFVIGRLLFGGFVGFVVPISFSMLAESTPVKQRGVILALIGIFYTMGELFACLLSLITLDNLKTGNWRLLLVLSTIPSGLIMICSLLWLKESPRFLLISGKSDEAFDIIDQIARNHKKQNPLVSSRKRYQLEQWAVEIQDSMKTFEKGSIKALFQKSFRFITPVIWYNWFVSSFVFFGITFILPNTLTKIAQNDGNDGDDDLMSIFWSSLGELPTILVCAVIVNIPFLGRKNSWAIGFLGGCIGCLLIFLELGSFTFWIAFSKLSLDLAFTLSYEYTGEIYPTKIRAQGIGMASSYSRIGTILMPWIGNYIGDIGIFLPYLLFSITSGVASILTFFLPFDTRGTTLDTIN